MPADTASSTVIRRPWSHTVTTSLQAISPDGPRQSANDTGLGDRAVSAGAHLLGVSLMTIADQVSELRRDVGTLQTQVGRIEAQIEAHATLSDERHDHVRQAVETSQTAIIRQITQLEAANAAAAQEATKRMQIVAGVISAVIAVVGSIYGVAQVRQAEPVQQAPASTAP